MSRQTAIVATTIFEPAFIDGFQSSVEAAGRLGETQMFIIVDRKTPTSVQAAANAARAQGFNVVCPTIDEQDLFLKKLGLPADFIPYNTDNRRNIGFLMALESGCEVLISIDDDNFCESDIDFVGAHSVVGQVAAEPVVNSTDGWFNLCSLLETQDGVTPFPRGFPYAAQRQPRSTELEVSATPIPIAMNAGLWLDEPDVDAVARLSQRPKIDTFRGPNVVLGPEVWSPINTQNTALTRDAALTYYYIRMGFPLKGLSIDRFGDILSGYLTQKVIKSLGQGIRIGTPVLNHRRSPHNLFKDLYHELAGMVLVEEFVPWLREVRLTQTSSMALYDELADEIASAAPGFRGFIWDDGGREFLTEMSRLMKTWLAAVEQIQGKINRTTCALPRQDRSCNGRHAASHEQAGGLAANV
jgi:hypothetical protein